MAFCLTVARSNRLLHMTGIARKDVVGLVGGLGNQLFQLAYGIWLTTETEREVLYDLSAYRTVPHYYSLEQLGIHLPTIKWLCAVPYATGRAAPIGRVVRHIVGPRRIVLEQPDSSYEDTRRELGSPSWRYGYWQHSLIAKAALPTIRTLVAASMPDAGPLAPIGMHVRRGDMVGKSASVGADWFPRAIRCIIEVNALPASTPIDVYTDSPAWVEEQLGQEVTELNIRSTESAGKDLLEFARHRHLVLSGSTFSWWAAMLTPREPGQVVAPHPIYPGKDLDMPEWIPVQR